MLRLIYVLFLLTNYRLDLFFKKHPASYLLHILAWLNPWAYVNHYRYTSGQRLRLALIKLGPIFIKFGQVLSTRPDLLPEHLVTELAKLQDQVPPIASKKILAFLEKTYQKPLNTLFKSFDPQPLAAGSIAQVHAAILHDGSDVVVKIVRPNIERPIKRNLKLLYLLAKLGNKFLPQAPYLHLTELIDEFKRALLNELNMRLEADHASELRENFKNSKQLYVPTIYWPYVREHVLVMERIYGVRISDLDTIKSQGTNLKLLAEYGVEIFYTQVFRDRFFHADMHPGNIFVNIDNPRLPFYCGIDFGIMGRLSEDDCYYLGENFLAFFNRDYARVAVLHKEAGWVSAEVDLIALTAAIKKIAEPLFQKPLNEISFGQVLLGLLKVAREFSMHIQPQLLLLQKTLLNVEGLGRQLYPQLDLWKTAKPHLEKILRGKISWSTRWNLLKQPYSKFSWDLEKLPETIGTLLDIFNKKS